VIRRLLHGAFRARIGATVSPRERDVVNAQSTKSVGIIGTGKIGRAMARVAARAGRAVVISHRGEPASLIGLAAELGANVTAGTATDASRADIVVLAVMWRDVRGAVGAIRWGHRVLIDPTNDFDPSGSNGRTSSERVAELVAPARVVKAANTLAAELLALDPQHGDGRRALFISGDDAPAKADVSALLEDGGFSVIDLGGLRDGGRAQQVGGPLAGHNLIRLP
jgi:predicted dinucleotide-binding enzyme